MKRLVIAAAILAAGCVGDGVEYGGVRNVAAASAPSVDCKAALDRGDLEVSERGRLVIPGDATMFFRLHDARVSLSEMRMEYDVDRAGQAVNIRFAGDEAQLSHKARRSLVKATADFVADTTYKWNREPGFATGCEYGLDLVFEL